MAELEQFRTTLHQANTLHEGLAAPVVVKASADLAPDQDGAARAVIQQLARAAEEMAEESARLRTQDADNDPTKAETRDGINQEA